MVGVCKLVQIEAESIKEKEWIVFKRYNSIYQASRTQSKGEFLISHITDAHEWRYINPDDPGRQDWDKFQKIVIEAEDGETYPIKFSEWQVILNCLLGKKVKVEIKYGILDYEPYATIKGFISDN